HAVDLTPITGNGTRFSPAVLSGVPTSLRAVQATFDDTGGLHAAGAFQSDGKLLASME
ncbi:MAG: formate dehydrogenase accessory sulfurtransferase FdhD, partial [Halioglobus sp.]|nr:formate dehydrogenase accessory sulfurtransferase FdhD [Halioglobus sp.]